MTQFLEWLEIHEDFAETEEKALKKAIMSIKQDKSDFRSIRETSLTNREFQLNTNSSTDTTLSVNNF